MSVKRPMPVIRYIASVCLLVSFATQGEFDPGWGNFLTPPGGVSNIFGIPGSLFSSAFLDVFGYCAYAFPISLLAFIFKRDVAVWEQAVFQVMLLFTLSICTAMLFDQWISYKLYGFVGVSALEIFSSYSFRIFVLATMGVNMFFLIRTLKINQPFFEFTSGGAIVAMGLLKKIMRVTFQALHQLRALAFGRFKRFVPAQVSSYIESKNKAKESKKEMEAMLEALDVIDESIHQETAEQKEVSGGFPGSPLVIAEKKMDIAENILTELKLKQNNNTFVDTENSTKKEIARQEGSADSLLDSFKDLPPQENRSKPEKKASEQNSPNKLGVSSARQQNKKSKLIQSAIENIDVTELLRTSPADNSKVDDSYMDDLVKDDK